MIYADYSFYSEVYQGNLTSVQFAPAARDASAYIDQITFGRLKRGAPVTEAVKMATCAVAEAIAKNAGRQEQQAAGVKSETVAGHSVTYEDASACLRRQKAEMADAANRWLLLSDPLRYAGV